MAMQGGIARQARHRTAGYGGTYLQYVILTTTSTDGFGGLCFVAGTAAAASRPGARHQNMLMNGDLLIGLSGRLASEAAVAVRVPTAKYSSSQHGYSQLRPDDSGHGIATALQVR
nr:hypothetical protein CFP56_64829 [Quercus suber]